MSDFKVMVPKTFNACLRKLSDAGQKKVVTLTRAAMTEAGTEGEIRGLSRTKHGEDRLPNVEKYDLPDAHRLVVQLVDGVKRTRAFLFVGSHQDADRWLDNHRDYKWVLKDTDGTLDFVRVTESAPPHVPSDRMDLESPESLLALPLLRILSPKEWDSLSLPSAAQEFAASVSASDYESDADGVLSRLSSLCGSDVEDGWRRAALIFDLLHHAANREWTELQGRLAVVGGEAQPVDGSSAAIAMMAYENSESFVTFDDEDAQSFFAKGTLADWMLFLHPEQKKVASRDLAGPARLRGVSGSGKTCVLVHRARHLAKKYRQPVALVTLTESLRRLLERLVGELCGVERDLISTWTIGSFAKQLVHNFHPKSSRFYTSLQHEQRVRVIDTALEAVRSHPEFAKSPLAAMNGIDLHAFMRDEISFVRGRLRKSELDLYLDPKSFQRRGRGLALGEPARRVAMAGIKQYVSRLDVLHALDHEGVAEAALEVILAEPEKAGTRTRFRAVLVDEVQDLAQIDIAILANLLAPDGSRVARIADGLFLAGDGAQTIYKRGFTLRRLGVEVAGRSFTLQKNYRNTHEILKAAFGLVEQYEFADVDEETIIRPNAPEFAKRHGRRPVLVRCESLQHEADAVASQVRSLLAMGHIPGQICLIGPSERTRGEAAAAMRRAGIRATDLRDDIDFESDKVKISTIESAKGHEFGAVFVMGLVEGVLPQADVGNDEMHREASRLYVAMTRARENLYLTYSPSLGYPASRFLMAVQADCDEARYSGGEWEPIRD